MHKWGRKIKGNGKGKGKGKEEENINGKGQRKGKVSWLKVMCGLKWILIMMKKGKQFGIRS